MHGSKKEIAFQLTTETRYAAYSTPYRSITYVPSSKSTLYSISSPPIKGVITRAPNKKNCQKWMVIANLACAQARSQRRGETVIPVLHQRGAIFPPEQEIWSLWALSDLFLSGATKGGMLLPCEVTREKQRLLSVRWNERRLLGSSSYLMSEIHKLRYGSDMSACCFLPSTRYGHPKCSSEQCLPTHRLTPTSKTSAPRRDPKKRLENTVLKKGFDI